MRQGFLLACAVAFAVGLAGCGGGSRGVGASLPSGPQTAQKQRVTFAIDVPKASGASNHRAPQFISPATTQLAIAITQGGTPVSGYPSTIPLTPTSSGCSSTLASTQCQLTISLGAGSYVATVTAEDANGTALSTAQSIAFTVVAGTNTTVALVLSGVPAAVTAQLLPGSSSQVVLNAYDADQNLIVGPGAPSFTLAKSSGIVVTIAQPATTAPNVATVVPSAAGTAVLTVTAAYSGSGVTNACALSGAVCSANVTLTSTLPFFVAARDGAVVAHPTPYANDGYTVLQSPGDVQGIASDAAGNLFVSVQSGSVAEYTSGYTGAPASTISSLGDADVVGANGDLYVAGYYGQADVFTPPFTGAPTVVGTAGSGYPGLAVAVSSGGELAILAQESISVFAPPYTGAATSITNGVSFPTDVAFDAAGDLFVVYGVAGTVKVYAPPYTGTPTPVSGVDGPSAVALDASNNLYVTNQSANTVTEYAPPYSGAPIATISGLDEPTALAFDLSGNLLVANYANATVEEFAPPYTGTPTTIPAGVQDPALLAIAGGYAVTITP
jgi:hypothetical protein